MRDYHGIIFAYHDEPALRELTAHRTAASLPFCGRYRLIDFALSSLRNAGIFDVGVIMQRDYQSLLDHIGSGKAWDMSRSTRGLRMLPPFGLPQYHTGDYTGTMEALLAVSSYIGNIDENNVILMLGNLCANLDLDAAIRAHEASGADATAICADHELPSTHSSYVLGEDGLVSRMEMFRVGASEGHPSLEAYIFRKDKLLALMDACERRNLHRFHRDAVPFFLEQGGKMAVYVHPGYARIIRTAEGYVEASRDMLVPENRRQVFPADRPVRTKEHEGVSTYYGENSSSRRSLVADNCIIDGDLRDSTIFSGVKIGKGSTLEDCIIMRGCTIGENVTLKHVIADKACSFSDGTVLIGSEKLPTLVPKNSKI